MTTTAPTLDHQVAAWLDATADLRRSLIEMRIGIEEASIVDSRKKKTLTRGEQERAMNMARGWVGEHLYNLETHNGVRNPAFDDAVWGHATSEEDAAEAAELADLAGWLAEQTWSDFAVSLANQYKRKGSLSPKQISSGKSMRAKVEATRAAKAEKAKAEASDIDLSDIPAGVYAIPGGDTRLKIEISRPGRNSRWYGHIFVTDGAEYGSRQNYGRQAPGGLYQGRVQDQLRVILADPKAAATAYGKLWGVCGSCGRKLEDEQSIAAGIGPTCNKAF